VRLEQLWVSDFRNYQAAHLVPAPLGLTVVVGTNGQGKSNLLEAVSWLASLQSYRGAPSEALVRQGAERAALRAEVVIAGREVLIEALLPSSGRARVQVNRQPLRRSRDLLGALRVSVFSPDDLELVKGAPAGRRRFLDEALVALHPGNDLLRSDVERVLRQRAALLRQAGGRATPEVLRTLDVWDHQLSRLGTALADRRQDLVAVLAPKVGEAYQGLANGPGPLLAYQRSWAGSLSEALAGARTDDLRRGVTTVGPHRDELLVSLGAMPARTHASQGEQRSLALALRLGVHSLVADAVGEAPVLLLDDVFSELDSERSAALLDRLPAGQTILTTTGSLPPGATPAVGVRAEAGSLLALDVGEMVAVPG
jgi:DNA replication and repair protein RecF